jgi:hypothetical protein
VFHVEGRTFTGVRIPLAELGVPHTRADPVTGPLKLVAFFDTVHIHRADGSPVTLSGQMARVVSELVAAGAPLPWHELAGTLWPEVDDRDVVRRRWDVLLVRLRDRLRAAGVRGELVRSSRVRLVELLLLPGDEVEDRT